METLNCLFTHSYDPDWFAGMQQRWERRGWSAAALEHLPDRVDAPLVWFTAVPFSGHEQVLRLARREQVPVLPVHVTTTINLGPRIGGAAAPCLECLSHTYALFNGAVNPTVDLSAVPAALLANAIVEVLNGSPNGSMERIHTSGQRERVRIPRNPLCPVCSRYAIYPLEQLQQPVSSSVGR